MASPAHLAQLSRGVDHWNAWRAENRAVKPDLSTASLRDRNLENYDLSGATLRGADLTNVRMTAAILDDADISLAILNGASLNEVRALGLTATDCSFVGAFLLRMRISSATLLRADLTGARLNDCRLNKVEFDGAVMNSTRLIGFRASECSFAGVSLIEAVLDDATVEECTLTASKLTRAEVRNSEFLRCRIVQCELDSATLHDVNFRDSDIRAVSATGLRITNVDFTDATIQRVNLSDFSLGSATLSGTRFSDVAWPRMYVRSSVLGGLRTPVGLPSHPIQDAQGIPPRIRRDIADAQFLRDTERALAERGWFATVPFRVWGVTCGYGQSLTRWATSLAVVVIAFALAFNAVGRFTKAGESAEVQLSWSEAIIASVSTLLGFGPSEYEPVGAASRSVVVVGIATGFFLLGALVSLLTNRVVRLSSE